MNVAYNTFLTALMVEYYHDKIADNIATPLNVTWSRTSPTIVSVGEDAYQIYMTLECDHSLGMTVIGTIENMKVFNFITSSYISPIEYMVMNSAYNWTFSSVTLELIYTYSNYNTYVENFEENGYIIIKSLMNDNFLVLDPETGIVRDINIVNNFCGGIGDMNFIRLKESSRSICCITWMGYLFYNWQVPDPWDLGNVDFQWDGEGRVYLTSSPNANPKINLIRADNKLIITGNGEKIVRETQLAMDITDILDKNTRNQSLHLVLKDLDGGFIGTSPLYLVQKILKIDEDNDTDEYPPFPIPSADIEDEIIKMLKSTSPILLLDEMFGSEISIDIKEGEDTMQKYYDAYDKWTQGNNEWLDNKLKDDIFYKELKRNGIIGIPYLGPEIPVVWI
ncbi:hypothetical protein [Methanobacterium ferruginis]|uniref:hypothetical protein n=1 Tax=Methanobacterium ferruginis TaxID=710191 RepID=UPI0025730447|nr:hypothetical protein [Methanobacterium ferruginis]BDZ68395.1 hypothetical protein GCM10025860_18430 [Methanobacterium ferruginis]